MVGRAGSKHTVVTAVVAALLLIAGLLPPAARSEGPGGPEQEVLALLTEHLVRGYEARDAERILALYDGEAQVATFTRGVLDRPAFASLVRENVAQCGAMKSVLEVGAISVEGDTALVPLRLILERTDLAGNCRVTSDRLYFRLRKRDAWKILVQTTRSDYSLPPAAAPALHH